MIAQGLRHPTLVKTRGNLADSGMQFEFYGVEVTEWNETVAWAKMGPGAAAPVLGAVAA